MALKPLGDRVLIEQIIHESSAGGVVIPENAANHNLEGLVISVGPGRKLPNGTIMPMDIKIGDKVVYAKFTGNNIVIEGTPLLILNEKDVLAIIGI